MRLIHAKSNMSNQPKFKNWKTDKNCGTSLRSFNIALVSVLDEPMTE